MKKFGKKLAMLGLMATMSIVGAISSFAVSIEYSDASAVKETGITIPVKYGDITISKVPVRIVSNENLQFRYSRDTASEYINFGYIENGQFISTFFEEDQPALMSEEMYRYQQLIDKEQLKKDKASGVWQDRTYGIMMFAYDVNDMEDEHTGFYMWAFKIDTSAENNTNNTTSVTTSENDGYTQGWKQGSVGWWYQYSDGSYVKNNWFQDVDGKWYYFNNDGYMLANTTTPDGYYVNVSGVWVKDYLSVSSNSKKIYGQYVCEQYMEEDHDTIVVLTFLEFYENMSDVAILEVQTKNKGYFNDAHFKYQDGSVCLTETSSVYNDLAGYWSEEQIFFDGGDKVNVGENTYTRIADGYQRNGYNFPRVYE